MATTILASTPAAQLFNQPVVQFGPTYSCFLCGAPATGLRYWPTGGRGYSPLDAYAAGIAYLVPSCHCHVATPGCTRVAVFDGKITPLAFLHPDQVPDFKVRVQRNADLVRDALTLLGDTIIPAMNPLEQALRQIARTDRPVDVYAAYDTLFDVIHLAQAALAVNVLAGPR